MREIEQDRKSGVRFLAGEIELLQETAEDMMVKLFEEAQRPVLQSKRVTVMPQRHQARCLHAVLYRRSSRA